MTCNVVAKKEASFRKRLKFTVLCSKPKENGLFVCTMYFRTEEVPLTFLSARSLFSYSIFAYYILRVCANDKHP